jgi:CRP-like cAMP-binding protein
MSSPVVDTSRASLGLLRQSILFASYPDADLAEIVRFSRVVTLPADETLFREGEACRAIFTMMEGLVKLCVIGPDAHEKTVEFMGPGETFAEAAMFSGQGYPVTAVALEDSRLIEIEAYALTRYLRGHPELTWQMLAVMSRRLHHLVNELRSVSLHSAEQRVARYLVDNCDPDEPDRPVSGIPARRAELAARLGLTTETLCRVISSFRRRGWVSTPDNRLLVRCHPALRDVLAQPRR